MVYITFNFKPIIYKVAIGKKGRVIVSLINGDLSEKRQICRFEYNRDIFGTGNRTRNRNRNKKEK